MLVQSAEADPLKDHAAALVNYQNKERTEDVLRIASFALGVPLEKLEGAQLLWVDRLGIYLFAATIGGPGAQVNPAISGTTLRGPIMLLQAFFCRSDFCKSAKSLLFWLHKQDSDRIGQ